MPIYSEMDIVTVGLNYRTAPISVREQLAFREEILPDVLAALRAQSSSNEAVILSTCNRTEFYAVAAQAAKGCREIIDFWSSYHRLPRKAFEAHLYNLEGLAAVRHLFRVSTSLDSQIIGENQILGQVKRAYIAARRAATVDRVCTCMFEEALRIGKQIRSQTYIGCGAVSLGSAAVELARKIFDDISTKRVFIIGAGEIAELAGRALFERGVHGILVANRTAAKAADLARRFGAESVPFSSLAAALPDVDIVISSVNAPHLLIDHIQMKAIMEQRRQRPIFFIDLGLPRTIEPAVDRMDNVYVFNLDDLRRVTDAHQQERRGEAEKAEQLIDVRLALLSSRLRRFCQDPRSLPRHGRPGDAVKYSGRRRSLQNER